MKYAILPLIALLILTSCAKDPLPLQGTWRASWQEKSGTMTSTLVFTPAGAYTQDVYMLTTDRRTILQACIQNGTWHTRAGRYFLRAEGQSYDWATRGRLSGNTLSVKRILDYPDVTYVRQ